MLDVKRRAQVFDVFDPDLGTEFLTRQVLTTLSNRELQILARLSRGVRTKNIAADLCVSTRTIDSHRYQIMKKLHLSTLAQEAVLGWRVREALAPYLLANRRSKSCQRPIDNANNPMG